MNGSAYYFNAIISTGHAISSGARSFITNRLPVSFAGRSSVKSKPAKSPVKAKTAKTQGKSKAAKKSAGTAPKKAILKKAVEAKPKSKKGKSAVRSKPKSASKMNTREAVKTPKKTHPKKAAAGNKHDKAANKKTPEIPVPDPKRRRARNYSVRSRLSSFQLGDEVIFERVRDWNDNSRLVEMRGIIIAIGSDPEIDVNYIEVQFEQETFPGKVSRETRRFTVK